MTRRKILKLFSFVPFVSLAPAAAVAADKAAKKAKPAGGGKPANLLGENEPLSKAMKYKHDATQVKGVRTNAKAFCNNCNRWNKCNATDKACEKGKDPNAAYLPCDLFPGKVVANKGWCLSWQPKS